MLVNGITPLNYKSSGHQKAFKNNRVSNQYQPAFGAWKFQTLRFSNEFVKEFEILFKLPEAIRLKKITAKLDALRKAGESAEFIESREFDYKALNTMLKRGVKGEKVSNQALDSSTRYSSLDNYSVEHSVKREEGGDLWDALFWGD